MSESWITIGVVGALVLSGSSLMAWAKFFMDMGATKKGAIDALAIAQAAHNKADSVDDELNKFKIATAMEHGALMGIETRIASSLSQMRDDIRSMNERLDRVLEGNRTSRRQTA